MKAYLMNRDKDPSHGVTEWWSTEDGTAHTVRPESLTFLGSKELFDQYDWEDE